MTNEGASLTAGTAALGQRYGVSNPPEQMSQDAAADILDRCWKREISRLDTAAAYGDGEHRIGAWIGETGNEPTIVSKTPPLSPFADDEVAEALGGFIDKSLSRLNCATLDGYLLHRAEDWRREPVRRAFLNAKEDGTVKAIGLSGYEPNVLLELMELEPVDIIQTPISLFDRSAEEAGLLDETSEKKVYVMARSIYLQGLLFMEPTTLPEHLSAAAPILNALRRLATETDVDLGTMALHAALQIEGVDTAVLGFFDASQVDAAADAFARAVDPAVLDEAREFASGLPGEIIDPRRWPSF